MLKVRILLGLVMAITVGLAFLLINVSKGDFDNPISFLLGGLDLILFLSAYTIMHLSFIGMERGPDGQLYLKMDNWLCNAMLKLNGTKEAKISLCGSYWNIVLLMLTSLMLLCALVVAGAVLFLFAKIFIEFCTAPTIAMANISINVNEFIQNPLIIFFLIFAVLFFLIGHATNKKFLSSDRLLKIFVATYLSTGMAFSLYWLYLMNRLLECAAILGVLTFVALIFYLISKAVIFIFRYSKSLSKTAFGQMILAAYNQVCPTFIVPQPPVATPEALNQ